MEKNPPSYVSINFDDCTTTPEPQLREACNAANEVDGTESPAAAARGYSSPLIDRHGDENGIPASISGPIDADSNRKRHDGSEHPNSISAVDKLEGLAAFSGTLNSPALVASNYENSEGDDGDDGEDGDEGDEGDYGDDIDDNDEGDDGDDGGVNKTLLTKNGKGGNNTTRSRITVALSPSAPSHGARSREMNNPAKISTFNEETAVGNLCRLQQLKKELPEMESRQSSMAEPARAAPSSVARRRQKYGLMRSNSATIDSVRVGSGSGTRRRLFGIGRRRTFAHIYPPMTGDHEEAVAGGSSCGEISGIEDDLAPGSSSVGVMVDRNVSPDRSRRYRGTRTDFNIVGSPASSRTRRKSGGVSPPLFPAIGGLYNADDNVSTAGYLREQLTALFQVSDNRLAMKLFGSRNALQKEKQRQKESGNFVIHPCSSFRFYWDLCMLLLLIANLIVLPVAISFFNDDHSTRWIIFNCGSDTVFLLDLLINFRTGIMAGNNADEIILNPKDIARNYLRSWFILDLISSLPLDYVITLLYPDTNSVTHILHAGRALRMFRLVKLISLLRLLRLSRLVRYVSQWEEFVSSAVGKFMRIINLICMILLLGHWNGCLQFLVPMLQDFPPDSWVSLEDLQYSDWWEQYTWALFKALSHMLSIGFGRYAPQSITDVWLTMISMVTGATCYALFVGHSTTLIQSSDASRRLYNDKLKEVEEYMISRKLPRLLRQRISDYYERRYHGKMFDEANILGELNECLREEIINFNCRALVASVPFFTNADPSFVSDVVGQLQFEVFLPGDLIIKEGTIGTKMFFIQEGVVDIVTPDGRVTTSLGDGSYFGEICLLTKAKRVASVRADTYCSLFSLSVDRLETILVRYPHVRQTLETVASERLRELRASRFAAAASSGTPTSTGSGGWTSVAMGRFRAAAGGNFRRGRTSSFGAAVTLAPNVTGFDSDLDTSCQKRIA